MKLEIDSVKVDGDKVTAIIRFVSDMERLSDSSRFFDVSSKVIDLVAQDIANKILLEKGPQLYESINHNQLSNAIIMRAAGMIVK